jgi:enoyl-CoA hydratase/carnithine racemase
MSMAFPEETLHCEIENHVLTVTLNRPQRLNALNGQMAEELMQVIDRSDADDDIRALIVTGSGRGFCSGFDLDRADVFDNRGASMVDPANSSAGGVARDLGGRLTLRLFDSLKPIIAAVNGVAVGIGATLLLPMDFRLASRTAQVGFVFTRRGIVPEAASGWFLPRVVGITRALDWSLSGRLVSAQEAASAGLFGSLHEPAELLLAARRIADQLVDDVSPVSAVLTRHMMWRGLTLDHPMEAHQIDSRLMAERGAHADSREGVAAFLEKRRPHFSGRAPSDLPQTFPWWPDRPYQGGS